MDVEERKQRIADILKDEPWQRSKTALKKAERELKTMARNERLAKDKSSGKPLPRPTEWFEQKKVCEWLTKNEIDFFAVSHEIGGSDVDPKRMAQFRSIGVKSGIPDLHIVDLAPDGRPVVLEMKRTKLTDSSLSDSQKKWRVIFVKKNWHHLVGFGFVDAIEKMKRLGYGKTEERNS